MESNDIRIQSQNKDTRADQALVSTASLLASLPGIHEQGAWGQLRDIQAAALRSIKNIASHKMMTVDSNRLSRLADEEQQLKELVKECRERMQMIADWNDEKAREIEDYITDTPFLNPFEITELKVRQSDYRAIVQGIKQDLA